MDSEFGEIFSRIPQQDKMAVLHSLDIMLEAFTSN
jgi:hypothetical protein